jgi:peptide/nickel transport system permease protein
MAVRTESEPLARPSRLTGVRRAFAPVLAARGQARWMLWLGAAITLVFVLMAVLAPVLAPYDFDTFRANGQRFPQLAPPSSDHLMGTKGRRPS